jgi:hypothetical protein
MDGRALLDVGRDSEDRARSRHRELRSLHWPKPNRRSRLLTHSSLIQRVAPRPADDLAVSPGAERTCTAVRQCAAAGIGRPLGAVSGPWFVMLLDGRVLGTAMHVLASLLLASLNACRARYSFAMAPGTSQNAMSRVSFRRACKNGRPVSAKRLDSQRRRDFQCRSATARRIDSR